MKNRSKIKINYDLLFKFFVLMIFTILSCRTLSEREIIDIDKIRLKKKFIGKPISDFLQNSDYNNYQSLTISSDKPGYASSIILDFENETTIELFTNEFKFLKPFNKDLNWDLSLFKKEKLDKIQIHTFKGDVIIIK